MYRTHTCIFVSSYRRLGYHCTGISYPYYSPLCRYIPFTSHIISLSYPTPWYSIISLYPYSIPYYEPHKSHTIISHYISISLLHTILYPYQIPHHYTPLYLCIPIISHIIISHTIIRPTLWIMPKYLRASPDEMPFRSWNLIGTENFCPIILIWPKWISQTGWVIKPLPHDLMRRIRFWSIWSFLYLYWTIGHTISRFLANRQRT